jgi:hypothetical protein
VLFAVLVVVTIMMVRSSNFWVHYEGNPPR